ncbi:MAG: BatD family protein [Pseudomonadota bacterium]|jgi:hypothetical protein
MCKLLRLFLVIIICCSLQARTCIAQGALRAEISPETGHVDDLFIFTVTYEGQEDRVTPQIAAGGDFEIQLLGPRTSISIVNGKVHSRQQFVYQLTPKREGSLETPEVQVQAGGQLLSASPITVVIKSATASQQGAPSQGANSEQIFMRQTVSPEVAYVGQQIVNAITVYTRVNLRGVRIEDEVADGFWQENLSDGNNAQRTLNGVEYGSAQILRALFALKSGQLTIPPRKALVQVPVTKRGNPFGSLDPFSDDFFENFFQRTVIQEKKLTSNDIALTIKPLPPLPQELNRFSRGLPIVGVTTATTTYSEAPLKVGESKNISIVVTSTGHLNPLKAPALSAPPGLKVYDGQTAVKHEVSKGQLLAQKTFNYTVVPTQPGMIRIPGVSIAYFDPTSATYKIATTTDVSLVVSGSAMDSQGAKVPGLASQPQPSAIRDQGSSSPPALTAPNNPPAGANLPYVDKTTWEAVSERVSIQLALLTLAAVVLVASMLSFWLRTTSRTAPRRETIKSIARAKTLDDIEAAIRNWAANSLVGLRSGATFDEIRSCIQAQSVDKSTAVALAAAIDELEVARYSGNTLHSIEGLKRSLTSTLASWR